MKLGYTVCWDLETSGLMSDYHEAIQVAGKAYDLQTLEAVPVEDGGEFESLMKPLYFDRLDPRAMAVNKKTPEMLRTAPDQKVVWNQFVTWVAKWNTGPSKGIRTAPIAAGKNIRNFDFKFLHELNKLHCPKKEKTVIFNERHQLDLDDFLFHWFGHRPEELENHKMDTWRQYVGFSSEGAHDALVDVQQTGDTLMSFLKVIRHFAPKVKFRNSFATR